MKCSSDVSSTEATGRNSTAQLTGAIFWKAYLNPSSDWFYPPDVLFPGEDGESPMWYYSWLEKRIAPIARQMGFKVIFQIMRRTFSTEELARDPKSVQAIMGHGTADMTANTYAQSQEKHMTALLNERWLRLGLGETRKVQ